MDDWTSDSSIYRTSSNLVREVIEISVWAVMFTGIVAVFFVLWVLAEFVGLIGRLIPKPVSQTIPQAGPGEMLPDDDLEKDIVIITSLMRHLGIEGKLQIQRVDSN